MTQCLQILIAEDNPGDAELLVRELRRSGFDFEWTRVDTECEFLAKLNPKLNLILSDFEMPDFNGLRALELLKEQPALNIPFIIVSGTIGEETAVEAIKQGAADYLLKDRIARLGPAVRRALDGVEERAERKRLEAQFIETQKMEVVGHLAGGVAHDFNNVLGVIMGYSDMVVEELGADHPLKQYLEEIRHATTRAAGLTQQLLIFSRKQTVKATELNLNEVIKGVEKMLRQLINENIELTLELDEQIGPIKADSGHIWQVLMNLVVNARDAMLQGGKLEIKTGVATRDDDYTQTHPDVKPGDYVTLSVSDTGMGMTDEVKERLFEAFFTTKGEGKGTGLGLVTCQTIIRQSDGHIDVSSELGKGTTFKIYFPQVAKQTSVALETVQKISPVRGGTETLLIVEDDPSLRHLAQGVLKGQGYDVLTAPNGQDALRVAREHQGTPISLVITDVIMPRMGGKMMAEWLKVTIPGLKVLFTSGYTDDAMAENGVLEKGIEFLPKPYSPASLARRVRDLLDMAEGQPHP
jgi:two-component system, cell cycle sensor histidine kinase and response regulator CckA